MLQLISLISAWAIPVMVTFIPLYAFTRKVPVYESFVEGAKDGFGTAIAIIPIWSACWWRSVCSARPVRWTS